MIIGILSDTHDQVERTRRAVRLLTDNGAQTLVHCGDLTIPDIVYACACEGVTTHFAMGNCDWDRSALRHAIAAIGGAYGDNFDEIETDGKRIAFTHGDSQELVRKILQSRPDYLLQGHTHLPADRTTDGVRIINPGALYRASRWTVATLNTATDELRFLNVA